MAGGRAVGRAGGAGRKEGRRRVDGRAAGREGSRAAGGPVGARCADMRQDDLHQGASDIEGLPCAHIFHSGCLADWRGATGQPAHHCPFKCHTATPGGSSSSRYAGPREPQMLSWRDLAAAADEAAAQDMPE